MPQYLANQLPAGTVRLGDAIARVAHNATAVTVTTAAGKVYVGRRAVVALPLGVLKAGRVAFSPALPADKFAALGVGLLNKVIMAFPSAFWGSSVEFIERISAAGDGAFSETLSLMKATAKPVLVAFNAATYADALEARSDAETVAAAMAALRTIWPAAPSPTSSFVTRWRADPFALGSYSYLAPGLRFGPAYAKSAATVGALFFAGEHTAPKYPSTVHGALESGRVAGCAAARALTGTGC